MIDLCGLDGWVLADRRLGRQRSAGDSRPIRRFAVLALAVATALMLPPASAQAQQTTPPSSGEPSEVQLLQPAQAGPPATVTLQDALERARKLDVTYVGAVSDARSAKEDRVQARNAMLPTITASPQYLNTMGNGGKISDGRFVTQDGVHVYRAWGGYKEDLSPALLKGWPK